MVTLQNYEEYIMLYVDEELDATSVKELLFFLEEHPELKKELELYQKTKLPLDAELVFTGKEQLIKQPAKSIRLNRWLLYAVAAGVALLIAFAAGRWMNRPLQTTTEMPEIAVSHPDSIASIQGTVAQNDSAVAPVTIPAAIPSEKNKPSPLAAARKINQKKTTDIPVKPEPVAPAPENPNHFEDKEIQVAQATEGELQEQTVEAPPTEAAMPEKKNRRKGLLAFLPISREKKEGLNHLKNTVESKMENVKNLQEELKNTSLEVKLGNRELFVINL